MSETPPPKSSPARGAWLVLGIASVGLGLIGAVLPLLPTTIFLILAAGCFARSSPRLEAWLLDHPRFGASLRAWRAEKAIGPRAKAAACGGMALGYAVFFVSVRPGTGLALLVAVGLAACAGYVLTRPTPVNP